MISFHHEIAYEAQAGARMCGAAALCMAFRSLGIDCTQAALWLEIGRPVASGAAVARTFLLCTAAQRRGLSAVILRARQPWQLLENCGDSELRVILNHRLRAFAHAGHFSVLVGINNGGATLHDPQFGPGRQLGAAELLALWQSDPAAPESKGHIMIALSRRPQPAADFLCTLCGQPLPRARRCPLCDGAIPLHPAALFGCATEGCPACVWDLVFCPGCDYGFR